MDERYAFTVEWYDFNASLTRRYQFLYFVADNTIEMVREFEQETTILLLGMIVCAV